MTNPNARSARSTRTAPRGLSRVADTSAFTPLAALPLFYDPRMVAPRTSYSPSSAKPTQVVESWRARGIPLVDHPVTPVTVDELALAHDRDYVEGVLSHRIANGFGNRDARVAASLPWTSGAMLSAARHVLRSGAPVALAPCSGFHHAGHDDGGGFCTFNGLMVTAAALHAEGLAKRVGILDCDFHYGDGTTDIVRKLGASQWVEHCTAGAAFHAPRQASEFFASWLPESLEAMTGCDVVLYQAGADPHVKDPLGGFLTTAQLRKRDAVVFRTLAARGIPVVWNLAGGYQTKPDGSIPAVLEIHDNTLLACAETYLAAQDDAAVSTASVGVAR